MAVRAWTQRHGVRRVRCVEPLPLPSRFTCGAVTGKGRMRALYSAYLGALDRETKLATTLGLQGKQKNIANMSAEDYIRAAKREAQ
jgi:hypothetical protein